MDDGYTADGARERRLMPGIRQYVWVAMIALLTVGAAWIAVFSAHRQSRQALARDGEIARVARVAQLAFLEADASLHDVAHARDAAGLDAERAAHRAL